MRVRFLLLFLLIIGLVTGALTAVSLPQTTSTLQPLLPDMDWAAWYAQESGYPPDADHFGAYTFQPVGDILYIGLGSARPAESNGALVARYEAGGVTAVSPLSEQGVHEMLWLTDTLHIAGTDPCCNDDWSAGNHYSYHVPDPLVKFRDPIHGLTNVIHSWGLWAENGVLYLAGSAHDGSYPQNCDYGVTCFGQIWRSDDGGATWTHLTNLGGYRAYDIVGWNGRLYALYNDVYQDPLTLAVSDDGGVTWTDLLPDLLQRTRLTPFGDHLLAIGADRESIYALAPDQNVTRHELPAGAQLGVSYDDVPQFNNYNIFAVVAGELYTIWELDGEDEVEYAIVHTTDLQQWETAVTTSEPLITLVYWPGRGQLIASSKGTTAQIYRFSLLPEEQFLPLILG